MQSVKRGNFVTIYTLYEIKRLIFDFLKIDVFCEFLEKKTFIRPNHITIFNWSLGLLALYFLHLNHAAFVTAFLIHVLLDNLDGYYARSRNLKTDVGECLDHVGDFVFGELFLLKSWFIFGHWWVLVAMGTFFLEAVVVVKSGLMHDKFPWRLFLYFFVFGYYELGLLFQVVCQPLFFVIFVILRWFFNHHLGGSRARPETL